MTGVAWIRPDLVSGGDKLGLDLSSLCSNYTTAGVGTPGPTVVIESATSLEPELSPYSGFLLEC